MIQHENREVQRAIEAYQAAQKFAEECKCGECKTEEMAEPRKMGLGKKLAIGAAAVGLGALGARAGLRRLGGSLARRQFARETAVSTQRAGNVIGAAMGKFKIPKYTGGSVKIGKRTLSLPKYK